MNKKDMLNSVEKTLKIFGFNEKDKEILEAMNFVDRKNFVDSDSVYLDTSIYIGYGQTISQPSTVARILKLLDLEKGNNVLEVGGGSGWNAALIGFLVGNSGKVLSLEIIDELIKKSGENLKKAKIENVEIRKGNFRFLIEQFDRIIFSAGISNEQKIEEFIFKHLKDNGTGIVPFQSGPLIVFKKSNNKLIKDYTQEHYAFVKLIS
jgi:protein-L-isoaspartate(D-aspartate) O-methyltransferase